MDRKTPAEKLEYHLSHAKSLSALPFAISKVLKLTQDDSAGAKTLAHAVYSDAAITASLLKRANSVHYGKREKIADVTEAIVQMGFDETRGLVLGINFVNFLSGKGKKGGLDIINFWKHSLSVGIFSRLLASASNYPNVELAFTAGLLHDVGKIVLSEYLPGEYSKVLTSCRKMNVPVRYEEDRELSITHQKAGRMLASKWNLPEEVTETIQHHHSSNRADIPHLAQIVHLADTLAKALEIGHGGDLFIEYTPKKIWEQLGIPKKIDRDFIEKVTDEVTQAKDFLGIPEYVLNVRRMRAPYAGDMIFASFSAYPDHVIEILLRNVGYRIRNVSSNHLLVGRLTERKWPLVCVILDNETEVDLLVKLSKTPDVKQPGKVLCFYPAEIAKKMKKNDLPYEYFQLPCDSTKVKKAIGIEAG
jgi:putative nucleotidyltransferase with HDIG domain